MISSAKIPLRQTLSLVMTPQLMQSIQLLQMKHFELNQFITLEVEKNPLPQFPSIDGETGGEWPNCSSPENAGAYDGDENRTDAHSSGWYDNGGNVSAGRLSDELDADYTISPNRQGLPSGSVASPTKPCSKEV